MELTFQQWIEYGIENEFCSNIFCNTHDGIPMAETEWVIFDEGQDPCQHAVRIGNEAEWESDAQAYREIQ